MKARHTTDRKRAAFERPPGPEDEGSPREDNAPRGEDEEENSYENLMADNPEVPTPSEDEGDVRPNRPVADASDDWLVSREEGVPYDAPRNPVPDSHFDEPESLEAEGVALSDSDGLDRDDMLPHGRGELPHDDDLRNDVLDAIRAAESFDEDQLDVSVMDDIVTLRGEVDSMEALNLLLRIVENVPGVSDVVDEIYVPGD